MKSMIFLVLAIALSHAQVTACGISPETRIIGGVDAVPGQWPWQCEGFSPSTPVFLPPPTFPNSSSTWNATIKLERVPRGLFVALLKERKGFICGGSLIASDWIVTAAHCISSLLARDYTIRLGEHNPNVIEGTERHISVKRVIKHPSYKSPSANNNDIALIQLERPATLNASVGTVCLPAQNENVSTSAKCFITGWVKIKNPDFTFPSLQQDELTPVTNDACAEELAASPGGSRLNITDQMICAGVEETDLIGCHGVNGGPYVCQASGGNWVLQGVVSWVFPTCSVARYTVFARVAQFRNWINETAQV